MAESKPQLATALTLPSPRGRGETRYRLEVTVTLGRIWGLGRDRSEMKMALYPLKFYEIYKNKIWGGRRIEAVLGKNLPQGKKIGESWEISDHFDDVSVVRSGPLEGKTLREVWQADPKGILGKCYREGRCKYFPLLVKFIDASQDLSVQVHPDDAYAAKYDPNCDSGKNEAWYVIAAEPGAKITAGMKRGATPEEFKRLLAEGQFGDCLNSFEAKAGQVIHVAAGTVHALGKGILICEIQQTSDATYRIWDWGRLGENGKPRPLHITHALDVIDFARGPVGPVLAKEVSDNPRRRLLDTCEFFVIESVEAGERFTETAPAESFFILICIAGSGSLVAEGERYAYALGDTILVPAAMKSVAVEPAEQSRFLKTYIP
jgi:mannose-6-phosphate isomerase